jgi:hypothetical protein
LEFRSLESLTSLAVWLDQEEESVCLAPEEFNLAVNCWCGLSKKLLQVVIIDASESRFQLRYPSTHDHTYIHTYIDTYIVIGVVKSRRMKWAWHGSV